MRRNSAHQREVYVDGGADEAYIGVFHATAEPDLSLGLRLDVHTIAVYTGTTMKNITLSADDALIEQARRRAAAANTTLNEVFRAWLARYVAQPAAADQYEQLMARLEHVRAGGRFTREEMNERR